MVASTRATDVRPALVAPSVDAASIIAWLLFSTTILLIWVSVTPFRDLRGDAGLEAAGGGNIVNQVGYSLLVVCMLVFTALTNPGLFRILIRWTYGVTLFWFLLSSLGAHEQFLSLKRLVLTCIVIVLAAMTLTLPANIRGFAAWIGGLTALVLSICYLGVTFAPDVSVHNARDFAEPNLAGDWRGVFPHKNTAGPMMVVFTCIGLFVARVKNFAFGWAIVIASVVFLHFSGAKTAMLLLPVVIALAWICERLPGAMARAFVALAVLVIINLASIGSVISPTIKHVVDRVVPDASYTGRTDIWAFAVENIRQRPVLGHGFAAFWRTSHVIFDNAQVDERDEALYYNVNQATNAHNGYLDIALQTGMVGLFLALLWVVVLPLRDYARIRDDLSCRDLSRLFFRIWLFGVTSAAMESVLFDPVGAIWFMMLMSMFGLHLMTHYRVSP